MIWFYNQRVYNVMLNFICYLCLNFYWQILVSNVHRSCIFIWINVTGRQAAHYTILVTFLVIFWLWKEFPYRDKTKKKPLAIIIFSINKSKNIQFLEKYCHVLTHVLPRVNACNWNKVKFTESIVQLKTPKEHIVR